MDKKHNERRRRFLQSERCRATITLSCRSITRQTIRNFFSYQYIKVTHSGHERRGGSGNQTGNMAPLLLPSTVPVGEANAHSSFYLNISGSRDARVPGTRRTQRHQRAIRGAPASHASRIQWLVILSSFRNIIRDPNQRMSCLTGLLCVNIMSRRNYASDFLCRLPREPQWHLNECPG